MSVFGPPFLIEDCFKYFPEFLNPDEADRFLAALWNELNWMQAEITMFGRKVMQPRLIAWYGEPGANYAYSCLSLTPRPWHPVLLELKTRIEDLTASRFNSVLANAYRNGRDSMGWHRDDEKELGSRPTIASLSLGAERRFLVREQGCKSSGLVLEHGSLLLMQGNCQKRFQHSLPKTRRETGLRINLTYREIRSQAPV